MIERYLDGLIPLDALQADLDQEVKDAPARQLLVVELLERIGACPQGENEKILTVFERISAGKARFICKLLEQWRQTLDSAREDQLEKIKISLKEKGLSGGLVPNLEKDPQWQSRFQESRSRFTGRPRRKSHEILAEIPDPHLSSPLKSARISSFPDSYFPVPGIR